MLKMKNGNYTRLNNKKDANNSYTRKVIFISILIIITFILIYEYNNGILSFKRILKFLKISSSNPSVCLCVIAKDENLYAKEYVNYYKQLGYEHIYIYDNNELNGEKFEDVIQDEIDSGFVTIINIRGMSKGQCYAYKDCYGKYNKLYDWMSFFDFDEFLAIKKEKTIQEFLSSPRYEQCVTVKINFLFYSDNELLYYDNRTLQERFKKALYHHPSNRWLKVTVRGGLKTNYWSKKCTPHTSHSNYPSCNSEGKKMKSGSGAKKPNFYYAALKHYYTKSTEEYLIKSMRGSAFSRARWSNKRKKYKYKLYFYYNKRTKKKVKLLKRLFNMT